MYIDVYTDDTAHFWFSTVFIEDILYGQHCSFSTFSFIDDTAHVYRRLHRRYGSFSILYVDYVLYRQQRSFSSFSKCWCTMTHCDACDTTHSYMWHVSFIHVTRLIHTCDAKDSFLTFAMCRCTMTHWFMWHDWFAHVTWLFRTCDMTHSYMWHVLSVHVTCLIHTCDMSHSYTWRDWFIHVTHSYMWNDSFIHVTWLIFKFDMTRSYKWHIYTCDVTHTCDMTHAYIRHDVSIHATWLMHTCDTTHAYVWHDSCIRATWLMHTCDTTHLHVRHSSQTHRFVAFSPSEKAKSHGWKPTRRRCARDFTRTKKVQKSLPKITVLTRQKNAQPEISEEEMRATFDSWDKDGDGLTYCTSKELYVHRIFHTTTRHFKSFWKRRSGDAWTLLY